MGPRFDPWGKPHVRRDEDKGAFPITEKVLLVVILLGIFFVIIFIEKSITMIM